MVAVRSVTLSFLVVACVNVLQAEEPVARATWKIQFTGNSHYNADSLRTGLSLDRKSQRADIDELSPVQYMEVIRGRVLCGYLNDGFRDVQVSMSFDQATRSITATVNEGPQWSTGEIHVAGLSTRECDYVRSLLKKQTDHSNPLQELQPNLKFWQQNTEMSFVNPAEEVYRATVQEALTAIGYPLGQFSVGSLDVSKEDKHSIELQITVTDPGTALTVGDVTFTGLDIHSTEQLIDFLELKSGMPLTLPMRDQIVSELLGSGRFLMAEVKQDPFFFDPSQPLDLRIHVREYDRIAPLGQEISEGQQALMKMSQWLSRWEQGENDLHFKYTGPTEQAGTIAKSVVPEPLHAFCNPALGTGVPGSFCIEIMTSPKDGSLLMFQVTDAQGNVAIRRTVLLTKSTQGLLAWQSQKKWLHSDRLSLICKFGWNGKWPEESGRGNFLIGFGINADRARGVQSEFISTPAVVMDFFDENVQSIALEEGLRKLALTYGSLELDDNSGALQKLTCAVEGIQLEIRSGSGLVAAEVSRLQEETKDWHDQCQPGREWPALAAMILEDVKVADAEHADILLLVLDLLGNEAALKRFSTGIALLAEHRQFIIPQKDLQPVGKLPGLWGYMPMFATFVPAGSFPHRLALTTFESQATGNNELLKHLFQEVLNTKAQGAVCCQVIARLTSGSSFSRLMAQVGLERTSTAEFQHDMAPFVSEPGHVREVLCSLLIWLQQTSDDDAEKIAKLAEIHLTNQDGKPVNVRPLLILIRSQPDKTPEEILASVLPLVWEGGLRAWVEADLRSLAASTPTDTKKYFNPASPKIPNELTGTTNNLRSWGIAEAARTKILKELTEEQVNRNPAKGRASVKPATKSGSLEDIKLDEDWDLDD